MCTPIGLSGPVEGVGTAGTAAMPACKDIRNFPKSSKFRTISHTKARCATWCMSGIEARVFIAVVAIAVALLLLG